MYGGIWFRAYMSNANVSIWSLIGMSFRRVNAGVIVQAKVMAVQAGIFGPGRCSLSSYRPLQDESRLIWRRQLFQKYSFLISC